MDDSPIRLNLPSGGWADFKPAVKYGARMQLRKYASSIGATAMAGQAGDAQGLQIDAADMVKASEADAYFPLCHLLVAWSYGDKLPTMDDLSPLDDVSWADGEFLFDQAHKVFDNSGQVDFSPNMDPKDEARITPLAESSGPSEDIPSMNGMDSLQKSSSIKS